MYVFLLSVSIFVILCSLKILFLQHRLHSHFSLYSSLQFFLPRCNALQATWPTFFLSILDCFLILFRILNAEVVSKVFVDCVPEENNQWLRDCLSYLFNISEQISSICWFDHIYLNTLYLYTFFLFPNFKQQKQQKLMY